MENSLLLKLKSGGLGRLINIIQTLFVSLLRIWSIPIVLMLSLASGFTTYYGMSYFITPWIALIITIAVQSIIVICSFELAGIHWKANRLRYLSVSLSLLIALATSISFSYFKFYEISERETIHIQRLDEVRHQINAYLNQLATVKSTLLAQQKTALEQAAKEVSQAYFGTHPEIPEKSRHQVGEGPFWRHFNQRYQQHKTQLEELETQFGSLDRLIENLHRNLNRLDRDDKLNEAYNDVALGLQEVQLQFNRLAAQYDNNLPEAPVLMSFSQFAENVKPSIAMLSGFSWFAFIIASMVDFFTVLLSYRLEFAAPGPLTDREEELVFECLRQFNEYRINKNDALEVTIEKTEIERARRYVDWPRMFAVGLLLSRGFLRKVDGRTVEFAPNLYPLIAEKMSDKLQQIKAQLPQNQSGSSSVEP
ncbi:MAG: hypothetical protein ACU837_08475 [Gammaproteobacteria bacterium]